MNKCYIIIVFFLALALNAQEFKVLSKSGDATKKNGNKWNKLKTGESLTINDQVRIGNKGYLVLTHQSSKNSIELNKSGTYDLKKIASDMKKGKKGVSSQLAKYFIDEISDSDDYFKKANYKEGMEGNLGAVDRGIGGNVNANEKVSGMTGMKDKDSKTFSAVAGTVFGNDTKMIYIKLPRNGYLLEPQNEFIWYKYGNSNSYNFKIIDKTNKTIFSKSTNDTSIIIDINEIKLVGGNTYYWFVESNGDKSIEEPINYLSDASALEINNTIKEFQSESDDIDSPMINLAIASYLADKNVCCSAYKYFKKVMDSAPDSEEYKKVFAKFLIRIGDYQAGKVMVEEK